MNIELVVWHDAYSIDEWKDVSELMPVPEIAYTTGFVVAENDHGIALSNSVCEEKAAETMIVPKAMIQSRTVIHDFQIDANTNPTLQRTPMAKTRSRQPSSN